MVSQVDQLGNSLHLDVMRIYNVMRDFGYVWIDSPGLY